MAGDEFVPPAWRSVVHPWDEPCCNGHAVEQSGQANRAFAFLGLKGVIAAIPPDNQKTETPNSCG
jgi:hypothetical protein